MSDVMCITARALCSDDFLQRLDMIAAAHPAAIVLREKDMPPDEYRALAAQALQICAAHGVSCVLHSFADVAQELGATALHMPLPLLRGMCAKQRARFAVLGASCHSIDDALEAQHLGCTYITAGHVFDTDCKRGLPGRGLDFLRAVCGSVSIPVYAIGGISPANIGEVRAAGAAGACVMSGLMRCTDAGEYLKAFES